MESSIRKEGYQVPQVELCTLENMDLYKRPSAELFNNKKVVAFSMVGANNLVCGQEQLQDIKQTYQDFIDLGIDEVYCIFVNDVYTLNEWWNFNNMYGNAKFLSDGNTHFTRTMGYLVNSTHKGYGERSWRYAMVVDNGIIEKIFVEPGMCDHCEQDPYEVTKPSNIIEYLTN